MAEKHDLLKCPLCAGQGEVRRSDLIDRLTDCDLRNGLDAFLSSIIQPEQEDELAAVADTPSTRNFQKDVHSWNPEVPMWRRSPKE